MKLQARVFQFAVALLIGCSVACGAAAAGLIDDSELAAIEQHAVLYGASQADFNRLSQIVDRDPSNVRAHYVLGVCFDRAGFRELASEQYQQVKKMDPAFAQALNEQFKACVRNGEWARASVGSTFAQAVFPHSSEFTFFNGMLLKEARHDDAAMTSFQVAFMEDPSMPGLPSAMAEVYARKRDFKRALQMVSLDRKQQPNRVEPNVVTGELLTEMGDYKQAMGYLKTAYQLRPTEPGVGYAYAQALVRVGDTESAAEPCLVEMANQMRLNGLEAEKKLLKDVLPTMSAQAASKAIDGAAQKLQGSANLSRMLFALADVYDRLGDYFNACLVRREGLRLDPNYAHGYYRMGQSLEHLDNYDQAVRMYLEAYRKDTANPEYLRSLKVAAQREITMQNDLAAQLRRFMSAKLLSSPENHLQLDIAQAASGRGTGR